MRTVPALLGTLLAAALLLPRPAEAGRERVRATELRAQCLFADPAFDLASVGARDFPRVLAHHEGCHGWRPYGSADLGEPVRCPERALDLLEARIDSIGSPEAIAIAVVLARNGREDRALSILWEIVRGPSPHGRGRELAADVGARLAARAKRPDVVLAFAEHFGIPPFVHVHFASWRSERTALVATALRETGRENELFDLVKGVTRLAPGIEADPIVALEQLLLLLEAREPGSDLARVVGTVEKRLVRPAADHLAAALESLLFAREHVTIRDAEVAERLVRTYPERVDAWLLDLGAEGRARLVPDAMSSTPERIGLLHRMCSLGVPESRPWFERYATPAFDRRADARWRVLTGAATPLDLLRAGEIAGED